MDNFNSRMNSLLNKHQFFKYRGHYILLIYDKMEELQLLIQHELDILRYTGEWCTNIYEKQMDSCSCEQTACWGVNFMHVHVFLAAQMIRHHFRG